MSNEPLAPGREAESVLLYPAHFCRDCGQEYHPGLSLVRPLVANDAGIGKTIEAGLIAYEFMDRGETCPNGGEFRN